MKPIAPLLALVLALAACHAQNGTENGGPQGPSGNGMSGRPSGANGTPSGQGQT